MATIYAPDIHARQAPESEASGFSTGSKILINLALAGGIWAVILSVL